MMASAERILLGKKLGHVRNKKNAFMACMGDA